MAGGEEVGLGGFEGGGSKERKNRETWTKIHP